MKLNIIILNLLCSYFLVGSYKLYGYRALGSGTMPVNANIVAELQNDGVPCKSIFTDNLGTYYVDISGWRGPSVNLKLLRGKLVPKLLHLERSIANQSFFTHNDINYFIDLSDLRRLRLVLFLPGSEIDNIQDLAGLPLVRLDISSTKVADISPLKGIMIKELNLNSTLVYDLSPLEGMHLERLDISNTLVTDVSALKLNESLRTLIFLNTDIKNISILKDMVVYRDDARGGWAHRNLIKAGHP